MVQLECDKVSNNEIKDLNKLLQNYLGENKKIAKVETNRLTAAGENYGSQMLAVKIYIQNNKTSKEEILHLVAKMCPPNEFLKELFSTSTSFKKEIEFYNTILPAMREFQIQQGVFEVINCFPECYGARISLDSCMVDDNAVLLLENLKLSKFQVADRMKGFDLESTKMILKDLAMLHAVPIAIKLLQPEIFNKKILPHLDKNKIIDNLTESAKEEATDTIVKTIQANQECLPFISDIEASLRLCLNNLTNHANPREPFATINHNDYWVNNTMIKFENNNIVKNKMVDFQLMDYGSPGNDIVFFLFSSVQKDVLDKYYEDLIKLYYNKFINTLKELKCDIKMFTYKELQEEIDISAKTRQFYHILYMLKYILAVKGEVKELTEITEKDLISEVNLSDEYRKKVPDVAFEFVKRKWIYT